MQSWLQLWSVGHNHTNTHNHRCSNTVTLCHGFLWQMQTGFGPSFKLHSLSDSTRQSNLTAHTPLLMNWLCWLHASSSCLAWADILFNSHHGCNWAKELEVAMIIDPLFISLPHTLSSLHIVHHNSMYCHSTMYCQKAFVPSMCVHCSCYCILMLNLGKSPSSFFFLFLFGTSAIWFKWAPLQLASLQLCRFMNCCAIHWRCSHHHLLAFCLPESFSAFCWQNISPLQGRRIASLTAPW